ncbi:MAG: SDR family NAD(P)-dependent oxidoreductase [Acidimicrobiales bacterium]
MSERRHAVVVGASSGVGRALATELAARGYDLVISARDDEDLAAVASDLALRHGAAVTARALDLCGPDDELERYVKACVAEVPAIDAVLVPAGAVADGDDGTASWPVTDTLVTTNFVAVTKLAGRFVEQLETQGQGTLVLFSSIAVASPRRRNAAYGAAKAGLHYFGRALQHRVAGSGVRVQVCVLGYVDTAMTAGQDLHFPVADPRRVARAVVRGLGRDRRVAYVPRWWRPVVSVLRLLPWPLYRRLRF